MLKLSYNIAKLSNSKVWQYTLRLWRSRNYYSLLMGVQVALQRKQFGHIFKNHTRTKVLVLPKFIYRFNEITTATKNHSRCPLMETDELISNLHRNTNDNPSSQNLSYRNASTLDVCTRLFTAAFFARTNGSKPPYVLQQGYG